MNALKTSSFQNEALKELTLNQLLQQGLKSAARNTTRDINIVQRAYQASKLRTAAALSASRRKSFGVRGEVRVTEVLLRALYDSLTLKLDSPSFSFLEDCPLFV